MFVNQEIKGEESLFQRLRIIIKLAMPAVATMLSYTMVGLVDTLMVGRLGATALAGVGLANTMLFTGGALFIGLISGVTPLVAQNEGAGRRSEAGRFLHQVTWLAIIGGLGLGSILMGSARPLLNLMQPGEEVVAVAAPYLQVRALGLFLFFLTVARDHFLEGLGDTVAPMRVSLTINALNIVLNYLLIFGGLGIPPFGAIGAAMATCLAHGLSLIMYRVVLLRRHARFPELGIRPFRLPSWHHMRQVVKVGLPVGVQFSLDVGSWLALTVFIGWMGEATLAASQIVLRVMSVTFMTVNGVSIAATTLVGQHLGAGNVRLARKYGWSSLLLGSGFMASLGAIVMADPDGLAGLFTQDSAVIAAAVPLLFAGVAFQLTDSMAMVTNGALKGAGDTSFTMKVMVAAAWFVGVPLGYVLAFPAGLGATGVYLAVTIQMGLVSVAFILRLKGDTWHRESLVSNPASEIQSPSSSFLPESGEAQAV